MTSALTLRSGTGGFSIQMNEPLQNFHLSAQELSRHLILQYSLFMGDFVVLCVEYDCIPRLWSTQAFIQFLIIQLNHQLVTRTFPTASIEPIYYA